MAGQLDQERRGGQHVRPGPPVRPATPDGTSAAPLHRAPTSGRHTGTRARGGKGSRVPRPVVLGVTAVALTAAAAFWLQDDPGGTAQRSLPGASPAAGTGTTPSAAPPASADPGTEGTTDAGAPVLPAADRTPLVQAATGPARDPAALRTALEQVLSDRAVATTALLTSVVGGDLDAAAAAAAAVDATSNDLEAVLVAWGDSDSAVQVRTAFDAQAAASRAFATAVGEDDEAAADAARAEMGETSRALGVLLEELTAGRITRFVPPEDAGQLRDYAEAQAAGDTASAADIAGWLTARMGREGVALATALAGPA